MESLLVPMSTSTLQQNVSQQSLFELYTQVGKCFDIDCLDQGFTFGLTENSIPYLQMEYNTCFKDTEWNRIKQFEFSFSLQEGERENFDSSQALKHQLSRKWSFWENCITSLKLGKTVYKQSSNVCSYQKKRMCTAAAIEGITITAAGTCHLPEQLESIIAKLLMDFSIDYSENILAVGCNESCSHQEGIHFFLEICNDTQSTDLRNIASLIISSQKDHVFIQEIVFLTKGTISSFQTTTEKYPRFLIRDAYLTKKLTNDIVFIYKTCDDDVEDKSSDKIEPCETCFHEHKKWLADPLSASKFDRVKEWQFYVPLPVRLLIQKAFVKEESIRRSQDPRSLAVSKIARLLTIYESS